MSDDLSHRPEPSSRWRESFYFEHFDPVSGWGAYHQIGERPARGHAGSLVVLWSPGRVLMTAELDSLSRTDRHHAVRGLAYECLQPDVSWRLSFDGLLREGPAGELRLPASMTAPGTPETGVPAAFEIRFDAAAPSYAYAPDERWKPMFDGHIDQAGRYAGWLEIDGVRTPFDAAYGLRDHSWGPRDWRYPRRWRFGWFPVPDASAFFSFWRCDTDDGTVLDGFVSRPGGLRRLTAYQEDVSYREGAEPRVPCAVTIRVEDEDGWRAELRGEILQVVPAVFPPRGPERAWVDRCLVRMVDVGGGEHFGQFEHEERVVAPAGDRQGRRCAR